VRPHHPLLLAAGLAAVATAAQALEPITAAGVRDAEERWSQAFVKGDTATLALLLDPAYVSVSANGISRSKAEIIAAAVAFAAKNPGQRAPPLPDTSTIRIFGPAAIVQHRGATDISVDVFRYRGGHWRALYSQHTAKAGVS